MATKGIQVSLSALLQIVAAVVISYLLTQVLGMEAKVRALEVKIEATDKVLDQHRESIAKLWSSKQGKKGE